MPAWVVETDADRIKTSLARVILACALKYHTRRGEHDPERWQQASQLATHGSLRDAGFELPPDAEAWDGLSVEQACDRLPEPPAGAPTRGRTTIEHRRRTRETASPGTNASTASADHAGSGDCAQFLTGPARYAGTDDP